MLIRVISGEKGVINNAEIKNTQRRGKAFSLDGFGQIQTRTRIRTPYFNEQIAEAKTQPRYRHAGFQKRPGARRHDAAVWKKIRVTNGERFFIRHLLLGEYYAKSKTWK